MLNIQKIVDYGPMLRRAKNIAIVGMSPKTERPSNMVARYLIDAGYSLYPVNPGHDIIMGLTCFRHLSEIPATLDIVNIFRKSADVLPVILEAIQVGTQVVWMQQGVINEEAAELAGKHGIKVVMDRCIKIEHLNLQLSPR